MNTSVQEAAAFTASSTELQRAYIALLAAQAAMCIKRFEAEQAKAAS